MKLRVVTATLGHSKYLPEIVATVSAIPGARHVLVTTLAALENVRRIHPPCHVVTETEPGLYAALNVGLAVEGDEDFVTWINDDDLLVPAGVANALGLLADQPDAGAVYGRVGLIDGRGASLGALPVARTPDDLLALIASGITPLAQPGTIFRRSALHRVGEFDTRFQLAGDLDLFVRALKAGVRFAFTPHEVAKFRLHRGQLSKQADAAEAEHRRVLAKLPRGSAWAARGRFRWQNLGVYCERVRRHGFVRMRTLYGHE